MTNHEAIEALNSLTSEDQEQSHEEADEILLLVLEANGLSEISYAYKAAQKRVHFHYI